jgi:bifunctional UDP-N-acetylglucosamine pyrophosphorylase/glucosamine-1-phosphate N-acetyltransferase
MELAQQLTPDSPVLVVGPETEAEIKAWAGDKARYVVQEERLGTGHAVLQAQSLLKETLGQVLVLYGDMPLLRVETLERLIEHHVDKDHPTETGPVITLLTVERDNPRGFGRIVRAPQSSQIKAIVEEVEATPEIAAIRELNTGIYIFDADFLWTHLPNLEPSPRKGEYYLTDLIEMAVEEGKRVEGLLLDDPSEGLGINTRVDLSLVEAKLQQRINTYWMRRGVTLVDPATAYIGPDVILGRDTVVHPNTHLRGQTTIGEDCQIGPNTIIEHCDIGHRCRVLASVLENAVMEDDSDIGPFGHLRTGARICKGAHMGNFGEMKKSTLGPGAKMGHFGYLGDTEVGANANIGAGIITCNYDGEQKHPTHIEDDAFIGSGTMLVAPVTIGTQAKIGAGSVVTHDIPGHSLAYGVPARVRKERRSETSPNEEQTSCDTRNHSKEEAIDP